MSSTLFFRIPFAATSGSGLPSYKDCMDNPNLGGRPQTSSSRQQQTREQMSAYWATNGTRPTSQDANFDFLQHDPAELLFPPNPIITPLRNHHSSHDLGSHFRLQAQPPANQPSTSHRRGRKSLKLRGLGGLMRGGRRTETTEASRERHADRSFETSGPTRYEDNNLVPRPLRPAPLATNRSVSSPARTDLEDDEDYSYYEELARSPGFLEPSFSYGPGAPSSNRSSLRTAETSAPEEHPVAVRKESVAPFDDADDIGLFVAATTGFNPMSPDVQESLMTPHIPQPPASAPLRVPSPYREEPLTQATPPLQQSNSWHYSGPPLRQSRTIHSSSPSRQVPPTPYQSLPSMALEPPTPQPPINQDFDPRLHPAQVASLQRQHMMIETPQMRAAASRATRTDSPAAYEEEDLENVEGDDELPDYATSQREAHEATRREAARRARELEMRWISSRR